jgi:hypothetical protein
VKKSLLGAVLALVLSSPSFASPEPACRRFEMKAVPFEVTLDHSWSIGRIGERLGGFSSHGLGFLEVTIGATPLITMDEKGCALIQVHGGYRNALMRIASELPKGSCAYEHVLEHENEHARLYAEHLPKAVEKAQDVADRRAPAHWPRSHQEAGAEAALLLFTVLREVMPAQHAFDSDEEYAKNATACDRAIPRILKRHGYTGR